MSLLDSTSRGPATLWRCALLLSLPVACSDPPVATETETDTDTDGTTGATTIVPTTSGPGTTTDPTLDGSSGSSSGSSDGSDSSSTTDDTDTFGGVCGDGILDAGEECDTNEFGGADCRSEGFDGGMLACNVRCELVTAGCFACGDGEIDINEECDGDLPMNVDCTTLGFEGGTLACDASCGYDTSGCFECGNGVLDPGEACDMFELGGEDCASQGFDAGILDCDATCNFNTVGCYLCGDGNLDPGESCDGMSLGGETCVSQGFDDGMLGCSATCVFDTSGCISFTCGDGVVNGADQCDGMDLAGETCASLGFGPGTLGCTPGCAFDTSGCCGDGVIGGAEACDGMLPPGASCVGEGFDGGLLGCAADCTLDTGGCYTCGDGSVDPGEFCDGANLGGATCMSQGFDGGMLACDAMCFYDSSGCYACGDGNIDPGEVCDGANLGGQTCEGLGMGFTGGALACDAMCGFDIGGCTSFPRPAPGDVILSEIMKDPVTVADGMGGEWVELHNPTGNFYQLSGCTLDVVAPAASITIDTDLVLGPGAYLSLAEGSVGGPGFAADFEWPAAGLPLPDGAAEIQLVCDGMLVDAVAYDAGATFPSTPGAALNLEPPAFDAVANDSGANWCDATANYNGDLGSPGQPNALCSPAYTIDFCRLQFPLSINDSPGVQVTTYGRLYVAGLTDQSPLNNPAPTLLAWVGYGPDGTDPAIDPTWTWTPAIPNPGWDGNAAGEPNNDEYQADLVVPAPGDYDYAYRFSGDFGATFTYCDGDPPGNTNGYDVAQAGQMMSSP